MRLRSLFLCLLALPTVSSADIQSNGVQLNGVQLNGVQLNGVQLNGVQLNGVQLNGVQLNGVQLNGVQLNGVQLNGIAVNGTVLDILMVRPTSGMPHHEQATGSKLSINASSCTAAVCSEDSYCCNNSWDSYCVKEANTWCSRSPYSSSNITGGTLTATLSQPLSNGSTSLALRVDGVSSMASPYYRYSNGRLINVAVYHQLSYQSFCAHSPLSTGGALAADCSSCVAEVAARDPYCKTMAWDSICVAEANSYCGATANAAWSPVCGYNADGSGTPNGVPTNAVLVAGQWNYQQGVAGGGAKISSSTTNITVACQAKGAVAKCIDMGYRYWSSSANDRRHQACVRMVRADYCGDGQPWTVNGTPINVWDDVGIQDDVAAWTFEATWTPEGATCLHSIRQNATLPGGTTTVHAYGKMRPYGCSVGSWNSINSYDVCYGMGYDADVVSERN